MPAARALRVREGARAGRTLEQVIASNPTADFDAAWGNGFLGTDRFVELLYNGEKR